MMSEVSHKERDRYRNISSNVGYKNHCMVKENAKKREENENLYSVGDRVTGK